MRFAFDSLETLAAVCEEGSFGRAATRLHVTPGAVSQRISTLERQLGHPVVERAQPTRPTAVGQELLGLAKQSLLLQEEAWARLLHVVNAPTPTVRLSLAINADSLSTWFKPVIQTIAAEAALLLDLHIEDQDRTAALLRSGAVLAAVTTEANAGPGCTVTPLGSMRYLPVCAPAIAPEPGADITAFLTTTPVLQFDSQDLLHMHLLADLGIDTPPPAHFVPSNREFFEGIRLGLGWSVLPEGQTTTALEEEDLVLLDPDKHVDVALYWQRWKVQSSTLDHVTRLAAQAAGRALH